MKNTIDESKIKCKRCNGRGEYRVRFYYKDEQYYYYSKCGHCYAKGYLDWVEVARGRRPGIAGLYVDDHPAGSCRIVSKSVEKMLGFGSAVYDGHNYIDVNTERGKALWHELITKQEE
jgi:hypothetical protein